MVVVCWLVSGTAVPAVPVVRVVRVLVPVVVIVLVLVLVVAKVTNRIAAITEGMLTYFVHGVL